MSIFLGRVFAHGSRRGALAALVLGLVLGVGLMAAGPALAAGGGGGHGKSAAEAGDRPDKETVLPRSEADQVGGSYMQLDALWLPVTQGQRFRYQAVTARLVPLPDKRVPACMKAPWAREAILFELNETPLTLDDVNHLDARKQVVARLLKRVHAHLGVVVYEEVQLVSGLHEPGLAERTLAFMCR
ncbi:hypothetical protein [Roseospira navarrensis]|uniref:Uncharacterized protein n=1 Tax=Roseospira navarrensis TaxID=140058 RepID=A0A7X2D4X0_9PROT|nr:hypothetical protein [Roseospira navarrensis]MQX36610.1 hypothetical protein [Roseospira navarrensis]